MGALRVKEKEKKKKKKKELMGMGCFEIVVGGVILVRHEGERMSEIDADFVFFSFFLVFLRGKGKGKGKGFGGWVGVCVVCYGYSEYVFWFRIREEASMRLFMRLNA